MRQFKPLSIGTSGISDEENIKRIELVNMLCLAAALVIFIVGVTLCYLLKWQASVVLPLSIEFVLNASVLFLNHKRRYLTASFLLYFLQCVMIIYLSIILGRLLQLELVIILLIAVAFLIFKDKNTRRLAVGAALIDLTVLEVVYYRNHSLSLIPVTYDAAFTIHALVLGAVIFIILLVSAPFVKSHDTNAELKRANNLIKIFVAQITHELRTPLDSIHHIAQIMRTEAQKDKNLAKIRSYMDITWTVSSYARSIINNVLDMAEIEAGKTPASTLEALKIIPFFGKMLEVHRIIAQREDMKLEMRVGKDMPEVIFSDPLNINQILTNLLANAFKYGARRNTIIIEIDKIEYNWQLKVTNFGTPIMPERIPTIFDPFVTGRAGFIQGSGLGLYIVKTKARLMGGDVQVVSDPEGYTTFTVILPLREGKLRDLPDGPGTDADIGDLQKVHIMVAEDDKANAFVFSRYLTDMGCSVTMVNNGLELLKAAKEKCPDNCPDIIILDSQMPILNGEETIRELKKTPGLSHIPIIVTTGDIYSDTIHRLLAAGANTYLKKPIDHVALQKTIILYLKKLPQN